MSGISTVNILPSRTRSGMSQKKKESPKDESPKDESPKDESKGVRPKDESKEVAILAKEYDSLLEHANSLYVRQIAYIKNPKERGEKYKLMSEGSYLTGCIKKFVTENTLKSRVIEDVQLWIELSCWNMRLSVFQQTIAVL